MKMNKLKHLLYTCAASIVCIFAATSCITDDLGDDTPTSGGNEHVTVNLTFQAKDVSIATDANNPENQLKSIRVYVFDNNDANANLLGYHYADLGTSTVATYKFSIKLNLRQKDLTKDCYFYIIANENFAKVTNAEEVKPISFPAAAWDETEEEWKWENMSTTTNPATLSALRFNTLPMYGENPPMAVAEARSIASMSQHCEFILQRSVAKLCLYFAKTGAGELYMDRGMYLYNTPKEGYLFPQESLTANNIGEITHEETNLGEVETPDSDHGRGGQELLAPSYQSGTTTPAHTNEIDKNYPLGGEPDGPHPDNYQLLPEKPVYMFAHYTGVANSTGTGVAGTDKGYYVKLLFHMHENNDADGGEDEAPNHDGEIYRVFLPKVDANDEVRIFSRIYMKGYIELQLHWMVADWQTGGGDIEFQ